MLVSDRLYRRHRAFIKFWQEEFDKDYRDRVKHTGKLNTKLSAHGINIKRIYRKIMAKKETKTTKFKWQGYCNINIPEALIGDAEKLISDDKEVFMRYNQMLVNDYRISVNFDAEQESFKATATCFNADSPNHGYAMSAYASDWYTALAALCFKHFEIADEDWQDYKETTKRSFG